jgi:hypothetical protein
VSTFYLLPPRPLVGDHFARFLQTVLPGLDWDAAMRANLGDAVGEAARAHADVFVVFREDLPDGEPAVRALADGFGAVPGDEVVEVRPAAGAGELTARRWRVAGRAAA